MPHMLIKTPLGLDAMMAQFVPRETYAAGEIRVKFMDTYCNDRTLLFEVFVHEPTIEQRVAIILVQRELPGEYTLKVSGLGYPRVTDGIHFAVGVLGHMLAAMHADTQILQDTVRR